ncbi:hypothetical protein [Actinobacillus minor]|uniref:hypothetical protein n=1 Tax=Actinobacillus minor TaxID=51047 RepID=UPI0026EC40F9|nr:hypothetical protein [Actinobacillus minor]
MSFFTLFLNKKSSIPLKVGIAENNEYCCLVHFQHGQEHVIWQKKPIDLTTFIKQQFQPHTLSHLIRPIPYQYIWRKYYVTANTHSQTAQHKQVLQMIKQELPIPLEEMYFDFTTTEIPNQNVKRISIYALRKAFADPLIVNKQTVLDCELHCWQRGIHALLNNEQQNQKMFNYVYQNKAFTFKENELIFCPEMPEDAISLDSLCLPSEVIYPEIYVLALGAALWHS